MGQIIYSSNLKFDLSDWKREDITKVFAGSGCVMAITAGGQVLQKISQPELAARVQDWRNVQEIAISRCVPGAAIGLVKDGTCLIAKKPIRKFCREQEFHRINEGVKSWKNILQVAASDAFFALDQAGKVHYVNLHSHCDDYRDVLTWENVARIVTGTQNSLFGITHDGKVLCAGSNCVAGPHGDLNKVCADLRGVKDLCVSGTACEKVIVALEDGTVTTTDGKRYDLTCGDGPALQGHFLVSVIRRGDGSLYFDMYCDPLPRGFKRCREIPVTSFAVGDVENADVFIIAVTEKHRSGLFRFF